MDQKYTNDTMFLYYKDLDESLTWLTQKTEEPKGKKKLYFSNTQSKCDWTVIRKWVEYIWGEWRVHFSPKREEVGKIVEEGC